MSRRLPNTDADLLKKTQLNGYIKHQLFFNPQQMIKRTLATVRKF